ncbi:hypothetical protein D3C81_1731580 [compost metagenome]
MRDRHHHFTLEPLTVQGLEEAGAQAARGQHVDVLQSLVLRLRDPAVDRRMISAHHAGQAIVRNVLYDEIVWRIADPAQHHRGGA